MLILRLRHPHDDAPVWAHLVTSAPVEWQSGSWETVQPLLQQQPITVLIPSQDVLLTQTQLVVQNQRQLKQALPYALEDALLDEPETQHIAYQRYSDSDVIDVAIIDRQRLLTWLDAFAARALKVKYLLPDVFALPYELNQLTVWQQGDTVWVRTGERTGYAVSLPAFALLLDGLAPRDAVPVPVRLYSEMLLIAETDPRFQLIPEAHPEHIALDTIQSALGLNLLTGFTTENATHWQQQWLRWRRVALLSVIVGALVLGVFGLNAYRLQQTLTQLDQTNITLYQSIFPDAQAVDARGLKLRVSSDLQAATGASATKQGVLPHLQTFANAMVGLNGMTLIELSATPTTLTAKLTTPEQATLDVLRAALEQVTPQVKVRSTRNNKEIEAEITLGGTS